MGKNSTLCYRGDAEQSSNTRNLSNTDSTSDRNTNGDTDCNANADPNSYTNVIGHSDANISLTGSSIGGNRPIILHSVTSHCVNLQHVDNANRNSCCRADICGSCGNTAGWLPNWRIDRIADPTIKRIINANPNTNCHANCGATVATYRVAIWFIGDCP